MPGPLNTLSCEFLALLAVQEAGGEEAVFGEAEREFVGTGGVLGGIARRGSGLW